jgi:hypothetical protein
MSGHQLLDGKAFDPNMLGVIGAAFDCAWSEIEGHFGETDAEFARSRLAEAILIVASDHEHRNISELKTKPYRSWRSTIVAVGRWTGTDVGSLRGRATGQAVPWIRSAKLRCSRSREAYGLGWLTRPQVSRCSKRA